MSRHRLALIAASTSTPTAATAGSPSPQLGRPAPRGRAALQKAHPCAPAHRPGCGGRANGRCAKRPANTLPGTIMGAAGPELPAPAADGPPNVRTGRSVPTVALPPESRQTRVFGRDRNLQVGQPGSRSVIGPGFRRRAHSRYGRSAATGCLSAGRTERVFRRLIGLKSWAAAGPGEPARVTSAVREPGWWFAVIWPVWPWSAAGRAGCL